VRSPQRNSLPGKSLTNSYCRGLHLALVKETFVVARFKFLNSLYCHINKNTETFAHKTNTVRNVVELRYRTRGEVNAK
jgi:hypothetical protein